MVIVIYTKDIKSHEWWQKAVSTRRIVCDDITIAIDHAWPFDGAVEIRTINDASQEGEDNDT